jgi:signal transduction histidine kinase
MENLKQADTLRRELVANVSHDLRTPLATLQGYIETLLLKNKSLTEKDRQHHLEIAIQHCQRLSNLVDELFELAKLDSREIQIQCEPFNISELAHDVVQKFNLSAEERQISIQIDHNQDLPFANADIAMIERVIENLLDNAVRHTSPGGSIRLTFSAQNSDISVCVSDTGCGIPEEDLPHIFDRFYHRDRTHESTTGYSGLGLAITKRILELHDKSIIVESAAGSGTTFTFFLNFVIKKLYFRDDPVNQTGYLIIRLTTDAIAGLYSKHFPLSYLFDLVVSHLCRFFLPRIRSSA